MHFPQHFFENNISHIYVKINNSYINRYLILKTYDISDIKSFFILFICTHIYNKEIK